MATIDQFKANLSGGGARANQFRVLFTNPSGVIPIPNKSQFLCKAAALPGQTVTEIPVPFRGRNLYIAGDREFETWDSTFINDTDFDIRNAIESWMNKMNNLVDNTGAPNVTDYTSDLTVQQLGRDDAVLKTYILRNCMPTVVAPIELSYETASAIEEFAVTWRYTHFQSLGI
jgi:hypothetical protein